MTQPVNIMTPETYNKLLAVALRYKGLYLDTEVVRSEKEVKPTAEALAFVAELKLYGYCVTEDLLHTLYTVSKETLDKIINQIEEGLGVHCNWAPLVKGWDTPTGEGIADHMITWFVNFLGGANSGFSGTTLKCGHFIPAGTFPIERYNGCPFCGQQIETAEGEVFKGQCSTLKELRLFTEADMRHLLVTLLESKTPLDATQMDSLQTLLTVYDVPEDVNIQMKETMVHLVKTLVEQGMDDKAGQLLKTPADILRYLWYEKTGKVQVIEPKTLVGQTNKNFRYWREIEFQKREREEAKLREKRSLYLKYDRKTCRRVATWLNNLSMSAQKAVEIMHPKRGMWVRMIRALRLTEYAHKAGFEKLAAILDIFYRQDYITLSGKVDIARALADPVTVLNLLQSQPGVFARSLFSTMLRYGKDSVIEAFEQVADKLPARLLISLGNAAENYFDAQAVRVVRTITGVQYQLGPNAMVKNYQNADLEAMAKAVEDVYGKSMRRRFAATPTESKSIYIDPQLFNIPVSVGDRSDTIQDTSCALQGTRFKVEGDNVRLFLQWGKGLRAKHLDMDLSARITYRDGHVEDCAYFNLKVPGAKHSGDIRYIPNLVGTAEYINLNIPRLEKSGAKYVAFTCNAYTQGALTPNLVVGWMDSAYPMTVSEETGVAYDPSCVQHMVKISENNLSKGLLFGVLDVETREIIWMEMAFDGQTVKSLSLTSVEAIFKKLRSKLSVGKLLKIKAEAQHLEEVDQPETADEVYTYQMVLNPAEIGKVLF